MYIFQDDILIEIVQRYNGNIDNINWQQASESLNGVRSAEQCQNRLKLLLSKSNIVKNVNSNNKVYYII